MYQFYERTFSDLQRKDKSEIFNEGMSCSQHSYIEFKDIFGRYLLWRFTMKLCMTSLFHQVKGMKSC